MSDISVTVGTSTVSVTPPAATEPTADSAAASRPGSDAGVAVTVSVTNSGAARRVVLAAYGADPGQADLAGWTVIERPVREIGAGSTEQWTVRLAPHGVEPGTHDVKLVAYPADRAPEEYSDGAAVVHVTVAEGPPPERRTLPWWLVPLGVMLGLVLLGVVLFLVRPTTIEVPDVVGQATADAEAALIEAGLEVEVETEPGPDPVGVVLFQEPQAGSEVEAGSTVTIMARTGTVLPEVVGLAVEQARAQLGEDVLVTVVERETADHSPGVVIEMAPPPGTEVGLGSAVRLIVATERTTIVPRVVGRPVSDARGELASVGLGTGVTRGTLCRLLPVETTCRVVGQSPDSGSRVPVGTVITLFTS